MHNLIEFMEKSLGSHGSRTAVEAIDATFSFAGLRREALRVAVEISNLRDVHCAKQFIAVYLPKGAKSLCAMLGVLYSGNVYIPMDYRAPMNRTKLMIDMISPSLIITNEEGRKHLLESEVSAELPVVYDLLATGDTPTPDGYVEKTISLSQDVDPAYILFTSGSTGIPKGVVIPHLRVIKYIEWARDHFKLNCDEVIGNQAPFYFTVSAMDIYLCLATGAKLCIIPEDRFSKPEKLLNYLNEHEITLIFWVSSVYSHIANAEALKKERPRFLKRAWFVGEPMPLNSLSYWVENLPEVEFTNLYGSTETDMTMYYQIPRDSVPVNLPIGSACANTSILILKDDLTVASPGEIGDIYVRGSCLASGYFKDPEKTRSSFIQNPLHEDYTDILYKTGDLGELRDGLIYFHGRRDHQFKHLGYRIEAGEIEAVAAKHDQVKSTCVLYDGKRRQIVLFYDADEPIDEMAYRRGLMADLPIYMVPTRFVRLMAMPLNANRKKDRILLKAQYLENEGDK